MRKARQICRRVRATKTKKHLKRMVKRARRRAERLDPQDAPSKLKELIQYWMD